MGGLIPLGIKLVCFVYILNTALFVFSTMLFYSRIIVFGNEAGAVLSLFIRFILVFIPLYLYFRLGQLKKDGFFWRFFTTFSFLSIIFQPIWNIKDLHIP